ncbi:MAG: hypothetical protein ACOC2C_09040 [Cyclonatronaceae bacterium]
MLQHIYSFSAAFIFLLVFSTSSLYAQGGVTDSANPQIIDKGAGVMTKAPDMGSNYEGTPYLFEAFTRGNARSRDGEQFDNLLMNYNAYSDQIQIEYEGESYVLNEMQINSFSVQTADGRNMVFRNRLGSMEGEFDNLSYLQVLYEQQAGLYRKIDKKLIEGGAPLGYGNTRREPNRFVDESQLYFRDGNGEFHKVSSRRRGVLRMFGEHRKEVRDFARRRNLDYDNQMHLTQMVMFYESQLEEEG